MAMDEICEAIDSLARLLAAEAEGLPLDRGQAGRLAARLAEACPEMRDSMEIIRRRMAA